MSQVIYHARVALVLLVVCCCSTQAALAQIAPTNSATISGSVSDVAGKPVAHAKVSLSGPKSTSTQTDAQGLFVFIGVPFGTYSISAAATELGTAIRSVSVEGDTNVAIQYEPALTNGLKVIANVSSSANAQFNVTPASITQVNPIANAFEGKTSWRTILEQIPGVAQAGEGVGESASGALPDGPMVPMQISINGALPYETATLLDDMPLISSSLSSANNRGLGYAGSGTDLGLYPLNGFGAADVVRGPGASAPSVVDSIGGSFVLHPSGVVEKNHYEFSLSTDPYGGIVANSMVGVRWKKFSAIVTYGVNDSPGPTNSATIPASTNVSPTSVNGMSFSAYSPPCSLPSCYFGFLVSPNYALNSFPLYGLSKGFLICCYQASSAWSQHSGSIALNYEISPSVSAEVFYAGQTSQQSHPCNDFTVSFTPLGGYTGSVPSGQLTLQGDGYALAPVSFQQTSSLLEEKITARIGSGLLQLAALQNREFNTSGVSGPTSVTQQLFGSGTLGGITTNFNGGTYNVTYPAYGFNKFLDSNNRDLSLEYTTPLGENLRTGASFVQSYYNIPSGDVFTDAAYGLIDYTCPGGNTSAVSQTTNELRFFVGGNPSTKTSIDLSVYFVNASYHVQNPNDPTGNTYVDSNYSYAAPRLGFVWRPTAAVAVRASAGGGFAEAPLHNLVGSNAPFCAGGMCTVTSPNLALQPEKSFGFDLGTDIKLPRNAVLSFDVYRTNLYGQLYNSTTTSGSCPGCGGLPLFVTQYGNLGESRYEGVLLDLRHDAPHGIYWTLSGGLTRGYVVNLPAGFYNTAGATCVPSTGANCTNLTVVPNINFNGTFTGVNVPYSQALGRLGYRWTTEKYLDLVGTYYGNNNTYFRPAFVELDGHVGYPLSKSASLLVTFRNITGIYDGATEIFSAASLIGVPTISGLPYPQYGEEYGPRTVLVTTNVRF